MCSPLLTGGLAGYGISQAKKANAEDEEERSSVTNNYYMNKESAAETNKELLKATPAQKPQGQSSSTSQTSRSDKAY